MREYAAALRPGPALFAADPAGQAQPGRDARQRLRVRVGRHEVAGPVADERAAEPAEVRQQMPPDILYQKLLEQLVNRKALTLEARRVGLDRDPAVQRQMQNAAPRGTVTRGTQPNTERFKIAAETRARP